jgi:hypothetical protein
MSEFLICKHLLQLRGEDWSGFWGVAPFALLTHDSGSNKEKRGC